MAMAVSSIFKAIGTLLPSRDTMPIAKAMSVAIGIPHPLDVTGSAELKA